MVPSAVWRLTRGTTTALIVSGLCACGGGGGSNPNPVLGTTSFSTLENAPLHGQLTASDPGGSQLTFSQTGNPASGTLSGFTPAGAFTYQPKASFSGSDSFPIQVTDSAGHSTTATVSITVNLDHAPVAQNVILRADGTALASINVLASVSHPDGGQLTVSITNTPLVGKASVNADQSVSITALPGGFKGLTTFTYTVTDVSGMSANAAAAIFVGADPFRAAFVGDANADGSNEVYLTDFAAAPQAVTAGTHGTLQLKGFAASDNGKTVAYRSQDTGTGASSLSFVQTASPTQQVAISLPSGVSLVQDGQGRDQFRVSPDGQWVALIAGQGGTSSVYVVNVATPTTVSAVVPQQGNAYAAQVAFTPDSKNLYFLGSAVAPGSNGPTNRSLFFVTLAAPDSIALISALSAPGTDDDVAAYAVSDDQLHILIQANRLGRVGLFFVGLAKPQTEMQVSHTFGIGEVLYSSTIGQPLGTAGSTVAPRVGYTTQNVTQLPATRNTFVAEVTATPNPRSVATGGAVVIGLRSDEAALLYSKNSDVFENVVDSGTPDQFVGAGSNAWYDSTGNIVLLALAMAVPGTSSYYPVLASTVRGSFPTTQLIDSGQEAVDYVNTTGFDRAVAIIAEGPTSGAAPSTATLTLVNAVAPDKLLPLANFKSPLQLTSDLAKVVTN